MSYDGSYDSLNEYLSRYTNGMIGDRRSSISSTGDPSISPRKSLREVSQMIMRQSDAESEDLADFGDNPFSARGAQSDDRAGSSGGMWLRLVPSLPLVVRVCVLIAGTIMLVRKHIP